MTQPLGVQPVQAVDEAHAPAGPSLTKHVLWLALPVLAEQMFNMLVGLTDTYIANHLGEQSAQATAAVGTITYIIWFVGLIVGAIATGSTALIARARGARHGRLANAVCGQSILGALVGGLLLGAVLWIGAHWAVMATGLSGPAGGFAFSYIRRLAWAIPFMVLMLTANSCLRGAGDTMTPARAMLLVGVVNIFFSFSLTYGLFGLPELGFNGIALGTVIAYTLGGVMLFAVLIHGRGGIRLYLHRMRPHAMTIRRILRIGIPSGVEGSLTWFANFAVLIVINRMDPTNISSSAHINTIRIESFSYLTGYAFATAAATLMGQALGRDEPALARRTSYLSYGFGGGFMILCGLAFIFLGGYPAGWMSDDPAIARLTTLCLFITGFDQFAFASAIIFGGALRGAGDTSAVMLLNLASIVGLRLMGVLLVTWGLGYGLGAIWIVLACELLVRGSLMYARFVSGKWRDMRV